MLVAHRRGRGNGARPGAEPALPCDGHAQLPPRSITPSTRRSKSVSAAETSSDPMQPSRLEKKTNIERPDYPVEPTRTQESSADALG